MKHFLLLLTVVLWGCGTDTVVRKKHGPVIKNTDAYAPVDGCPVSALARIHDAKFVPYLARFRSDAKRNEVGCYRTAVMYFDEVTLEPTEVEGRVLGFCQPSLRIVIDTPSWEDMSYTDRRTLIYHELGHCALGLEHTEETEEDIMNPYLLDVEVASRKWKELVTKMFLRAKEEHSNEYQ